MSSFGLLPLHDGADCGPHAGSPHPGLHHGSLHGSLHDGPPGAAGAAGGAAGAGAGEGEGKGAGEGEGALLPFDALAASGNKALQGSPGVRL